MVKFIRDQKSYSNHTASHTTNHTAMTPPERIAVQHWFPTCGPRAKSGPPGLKKWPSTSWRILKIYVQQLHNSHFDRVGQWGMSRYARYGENNKFFVEIEKFLVALNAEKFLGTCQKRSLFAVECFKMHCRLGLRPRPRWGSLQRSPRTPSCWSGGGWGEERGGRRGEGM